MSGSLDERAEQKRAIWRVLLGALASIALGAIVPATAGPPEMAATIELDGIRDASYAIIASDPAGDLAPPIQAIEANKWTDLTGLYAANDANTLYVYAPLEPHYSSVHSIGEFGLAIDTSGDVPESGGLVDPWSSGITFAYTATQGGGSAGLLETQFVIRPEIVIRGNITGSNDDPDNASDGWSELLRWQSDTWSGGEVNWGGIPVKGMIGTKLALAQGTGVELAIPFSDLAWAPGTPLLMQFFTTRANAAGSQGVYDTVPSDSQAGAAGEPTVQRILARYNPIPPPGALAAGFSSPSYVVMENAGVVPISITLTYPATQTVTITVSIARGSAPPDQYDLGASQVAIPPGAAVGTLAVTLVDNNQLDGERTVRLMLERATNAWIGAASEALLTIFDDDTPAVTPTEDAPNYKVYLPILGRQATNAINAHSHQGAH